MLDFLKTTLAEILPVVTHKFASLPTSTNKDGTQIIHAYGQLLCQHVAGKTPEDLINDHATAVVFNHGKAPITSNISKTWWSTEKDGQPCFLARAMLCFGPADLLAPPHYPREKLVNNGILCQPHACNDDKTPIESLFHVFLQEADGVGTIDDAVEIFTSTDSVANTTIDNYEIFFVINRMHSALVPVSAKRLDLVHAIRTVFFLGLLVFYSNPVDFQHYHPRVLYQAIFSRQTNLIPPNLDKTLSPATRANWLFALGTKIFEKIRKEFDATFFLNNATLFPTSPVHTLMPLAGLLRTAASSYHASDHATDHATDHASDQAADQASDHASNFDILYFLWGVKVNHDDNEPDDNEPDSFCTVTAQPLDAKMITIYDHIQNDNLHGLSRHQLSQLIILTCPKNNLNVSKKLFGLENKTNMIAFIKKHHSTFLTNNPNLDTYISELKTLAGDID
jgi:hypothetical protein